MAMVTCEKCNGQYNDDPKFFENGIAVCPFCGYSPKQGTVVEKSNTSPKSFAIFRMCPICASVYNNSDVYYCKRCNARLVDYTDETAKQIKSDEIGALGKQSKSNSVHLPTCPTCQSTDVQKISLLSKALGIGALGFFSTTARSQFKCNNCGYKW